MKAIKSKRTPILTFFNNKGGIGKTSLVRQLSMLFAKMGKRVLAADLDPQASLTASFLEETEIENLWNEKKPGSTIFNCVKPLMDVGRFVSPELQKISPDLYLLPGEFSLYEFEPTLVFSWTKSMGEDKLYRAMRVLSSFGSVLRMGADDIDADIILVDIASSLGAIDRSIALSSDYIFFQTTPDLFSMQSLKITGPILRLWKYQWGKRLQNWEENRVFMTYPKIDWNEGKMLPIGYVLVHHNKPEEMWVDKISQMYHKVILEESDMEKRKGCGDSECLAFLNFCNPVLLEESAVDELAKKIVGKLDI